MMEPAPGLLLARVAKARKARVKAKAKAKAKARKARAGRPAQPSLGAEQANRSALLLTALCWSRDADDMRSKEPALRGRS